MAEKTYPNQDITLEAGGLTIGSVELKSGASADKAAVSATGELSVKDANSDDALADLDSIDGKITACDTGAVTVSSLPDVGLDIDAAELAINSGMKNVATAGAAEALAASETFAWRIDIGAHSTNTGKVYLGDSSVDKTTNPSAPLAAGDTYTITCPPGARIDLSTIYVDADTSGEGVGFIYYTIS